MQYYISSKSFCSDIPTSVVVVLNVAVVPGGRISLYYTSDNIALSHPPMYTHQVDTSTYGEQPPSKVLFLCGGAGTVSDIAGDHLYSVGSSRSIHGAHHTYQQRPTLHSNSTLGDDDAAEAASSIFFLRPAVAARRAVRSHAPYPAPPRENGTTFPLTTPTSLLMQRTCRQKCQQQQGQ